MLPVEKWRFLNGQARESSDVRIASNCEFYALLSSDERYIQVEQSSKAFHFLPSGLNGGFSALLPA